MRSAGDDDAVEIELIAGEPEPARQQPQPKKVPRRRTPNPTADEIVHSGEIPASRALIIRSGEHPKTDSQPKIEVHIEPEAAKPVAAARPVAPNRRAIWIAGAVAVVGALGVAAVLFLKPGPSTSAPAAHASSGDGAGANKAALEAATQFIAMTLDAEMRGASVRVEAMASSSMLKAGIDTDSQTLADQVKDNDVTFPIKANEVVEVYQGTDGKLTPMLMLPADAEQIRPPQAGKPRIELARNTLVAIASAPIVTQAGQRGVLVLAVPISLDRIRSRVEPYVKQAALVGLATPLTLVKGPTTGTKVSIPITVDSIASLKLDAVVAETAPAAH